MTGPALMAGPFSFGWDCQTGRVATLTGHQPDNRSALLGNRHFARALPKKARYDYVRLITDCAALGRSGRVSRRYAGSATGAGAGLPRMRSEPFSAITMVAE
jgi:hypothetical protein